MVVFILYHEAIASYILELIKSTVPVVLTLAMRQSILVGVVMKLWVCIMSKMFYTIKPARNKLSFSYNKAYIASY